MDVTEEAGWKGRSHERRRRLDAFPADALAATLDRDDPAYDRGVALPPLWHWLYFNAAAPHAQLGPDGHERRGGFLPPIDLPRRMWAGGRLRFPKPLRIGEEASCRSTVLGIERKQGRTGALVFVRVGHEVAGPEGLAISEEHDIVYRDVGVPGGATPPAAEPALWRRIVRPDPVLLFRYSALTFNGHRIHYDHVYATEVEGYPGLVVHGPLLATLLLDLLRRERPEALVTAFDFRALKPLFDTGPFAVCGRPAADGRRVQLWAEDAAGAVAMTATATLGPD